MVLVGLGILVASFTFILYKASPTQWSALLDRWRRKSVKGGNAPDHALGDKGVLEKGPSREKGSINDEKVERAFEADEVRSASSQRTLESKAQREEKADMPARAAEKSQNEKKTPTLQDEMTQRAQRTLGSPSVSRQTTSRSTMPPLPRLSTPQSIPPQQPTSCAKPTASSRIIPTTTARQSARPSPSSSSLMPPPTRTNATSLRPLPKNPNSLNPPPSAASSLRLPPSRNTQLPSSSSLNAPLTTSTLPVPSRLSKKVLLSPGHSPLDWAALTSKPPTPQYFRGTDVPIHLIKIAPSQLRAHNGRKGMDAWSAWQGRVYNVSRYLDFHPGGRGEMMRGVGKEDTGLAEKLFNEVHPWVNWEGMLGECLVGILVGEGEGWGQQGGGNGGGSEEESGGDGMDDMD
ncbi:hypothetical protein MMC25_007997 [Agyrium rufum]|nr:hypothetical protein [Agyrium rufum]